MLTADLHTHTTYSHGKGSVEENVRAAIGCGLKRIAISEHGPRHMFFPVQWPELIKLRREIDRMNSVYGNQIEVLMGLEANLLGDGLTDVPEDTSIFDFVLLGYHKGTFPTDAISRGWWRSLVFRQRAGAHAADNAAAYTHAMDSTEKLLAITHPGTYIPVDIPALARAAAAHGVALELNEGHHSMTLGDVLAAKAEGASFLISSDAHRPDRVGRVPQSLALAREAGVLDRVINWDDGNGTNEQ